MLSMAQCCFVIRLCRFAPPSRLEMYSRRSDALLPSDFFSVDVTGDVGSNLLCPCISAWVRKVGEFIGCYLYAKYFYPFGVVIWQDVSNSLCKTSFAHYGLQGYMKIFKSSLLLLPQRGDFR